MNATADINPWDGEKFLYPDLVCWSCGQVAAVANIPGQDGALLVKLCANCLQDGLVAINAATLARFRMDSDDDGEPD